MIGRIAIYCHSYREEEKGEDTAVTRYVAANLDLCSRSHVSRRPSTPRSPRSILERQPTLVAVGARYKRQQQKLNNKRHINSSSTSKAHSLNNVFENTRYFCDVFVSIRYKIFPLRVDAPLKDPNRGGVVLDHLSG